MNPPTTRAAKRILEAVQIEFGEHGFEATTVRVIAYRATVDPSLVIQYHGSKDGLFAIATRLDLDRSLGSWVWASCGSVGRGG